MSTQINDVWSYFTSLGNKVAECNLCEQKYSFKTTTTNLKRHLKAKHLSSYMTLTTRQEEVAPRILDVSTLASSATVELDAGLSDTPPPLSISFTGNASGTLRSPRPKRQREISSYATRRLERGEIKDIHNALLNLFIQDFQPFSVVEDKGFRELIQKLNPNYELPSRKYISSTLIPGAYTNKVAVVKEELQNYAEKVCITTDCWKSRKMESFMAVTVHFLKDDTEKLELKSILLDCEHFSGAHTSESLSKALIEIVERWGLKEKVTFAVSDNAPNITKAIKTIGWPHFGCYVRALNLVVEKSLAPYQCLIEKIKKIVAHIHRSTSATEHLIKYQTDFQKKSKPLLLKKCVPTRWNSIFYMMERMSTLQETLQAIMPLLNIDVLVTVDEWGSLKELCTILRPFEEVTTQMSGEKYLSASMAIVLTDGLKYICDQLKNDMKYNVSTQMLEQLKKELNARYENLEFTAELAMSTFMDPRFKNHCFSDQAAATDIQEHIVFMINRELSAHPIAKTTTTIDSTPSSSSKYSVWLKMENSLETIRQPISSINKAQEEVTMYLNEEMLDRNSCPLRWWNSRKYIYPNLFRLYKSNCHVVATSVPCEKVFSKAGYIISERRTRLIAKRVRELIFLNNNSYN